MQRKILVVEDEPLVAQDLALILEQGGYNVIGVANNGTIALDYISSRNPELVLLDIALDANHSGFDIAEILKTKYEIPFIFITAFSDSYTLSRAKELMPEGYIVKPFKKKDVLINVEIALHRVDQKPDSVFLSLEELNQKIVNNIFPKEYEICIDIVNGMSNDDISKKHFISQNTVKTHIKRLFQKLDLDSRMKLTSKVLRDI